MFKAFRVSSNVSKEFEPSGNSGLGKNLSFKAISNSELGNMLMGGGHACICKDFMVKVRFDSENSSNNSQVEGVTSFNLSGGKNLRFRGV